MEYGAANVDNTGSFSLRDFKFRNSTFEILYILKKLIILVQYVCRSRSKNFSRSKNEGNIFSGKNQKFIKKEAKPS